MSNARRTVVLAIDDDRDWLNMLGAVLSDDLDLRLCLVPAEALALALALRPQLILLDLGLPGHDGERLLADLSVAAPDVAIVVLSARGEIGAVVRCIHAGARDYLPKNLPKAVLIERIRGHARHIGTNFAPRDPDTGRIYRAVSACTRLPEQRDVHGIVIDEALRRCEGNCSAAARLLNLTPQAVSAYVRKRRLSESVLKRHDT